MKLSEFEYSYPEEAVAQFPTENRDDARLMVLHKKTGEIEHRVFKDLLDYFDDKDVMVVNNTRVFPAKLYGDKEKTHAKIEVFLLRELNHEQHLWDVLVDPARKIRIGNKLYFGEDNSMVAEVIDNTTSRGRTLRFLFDGSNEEFREALYSLGQTPLPDCIKREPVPEDAENYQTIFAEVEGAVASPTAALHFSRQLYKRCEIKGIDFAKVTLHVGTGIFREVEVEDLTKHKMDSEQLRILDVDCDMINRAKDDGRQICAVGTTVLRSLESAVSTMGHVTPFDGWTNKFIFPPYEFQTATSLISNFHPSMSTMLMLVCAFGGYKEVMEAHNLAIQEGYRIGPYGDALLII